MPNTAGRIAIESEPLSRLGAHAEISIGFLVERALEPSLSGDAGLNGIVLSEVSVDRPWQKDYDLGDGNAPTKWAERFDLTNWGLLAAYDSGIRVGGAVIAYRTPELNMLEGREDLAVLWDLRVAPPARSRGVGSALFHAAEAWARDRGCTAIKVETQNINVAACRFYVHMGCTLGAINRHAYPKLPDETQLLWYRQLMR